MPRNTAAIGGGLPAGRRELAGQRTNGEEHDRRGHHGQGEIEGGSDRDVHFRVQTREDRDNRRDRPQCKTPTPRPRAPVPRLLAGWSGR